MANIVYVWGTGPANSELIRNGEITTTAAEVAMEHGFTFDSPDDWAVEVEATPEDIDAATLFDPSVKGWDDCRGYDD